MKNKARIKRIKTSIIITSVISIIYAFLVILAMIITDGMGFDTPQKFDYMKHVVYPVSFVITIFFSISLFIFVIQETVNFLDRKFYSSGENEDKN